MVNSLGRLLADAFFPQRCALCGLRSDSPLPMCAGCRADLVRNAHACRRCAISLPAPMPGARSSLAAGGAICGACLTHPPPFAQAIAPWIYDEHMAHIIQRWKYQSERWLTPLLSDLWHRGATHSHNIDLMVPAPMHWQRRWRRGYNQAELLARQLQRQRGSPVQAAVHPTLVRRNRATRPQSGMGAGERKANLRGAFTVLGPCDNLRIAIVDDVLTTGATAAAIAHELAAAGAAHIEVWCLARTPAPAG